MQQVRLVSAGTGCSPPSTVALTTSVLYIGQAAGSAVGGVLFARERLHMMGFVAIGFVLSALILFVIIAPGRRRAAPASTRAADGVTRPRFHASKVLGKRRGRAPGSAGIGDQRDLKEMRIILALVAVLYLATAFAQAKPALMV